MPDTLPGAWPVFTCEHFSESLCHVGAIHICAKMGDVEAQRGNIICRPSAPWASALHPHIRLCGLCRPHPSPRQRGPFAAWAFPSQGRLCVTHWGWGEGQGELESSSLLFLQRGALSALVTGAGLPSLSTAPFSAVKFRLYYPSQRAVRMNWHNGCEELLKDAVQNILPSW